MTSKRKGEGGGVKKSEYAKIAGGHTVVRRQLLDVKCKICEKIWKEENKKYIKILELIKLDETRLWE